MTLYKSTPIRQWQLDKITQKLKDIEEQKGGRKLTHLEKIYHIFAYMYKHFDTEEEEETKGVSARELVLILGTNKITMKELKEAEERYGFSRYHGMYDHVYKAIRNAKTTIRRFDKWQENGFNGYNPYPDTKFNIHCLRTKQGNWYYFNVMNDKDIDKVRLRDARSCLGIQKRQDRLYDIANDPRHTARIKAKYNELMKEIEQKQTKANLEKQQKKKKEREKEKPHVDVSLNKKMEEYIEYNKTKEENKK